jgi:hypothetical protein
MVVAVAVKAHVGQAAAKAKRTELLRHFHGSALVARGLTAGFDASDSRLAILTPFASTSRSDVVDEGGRVVVLEGARASRQFAYGIL